MHHPPTVYGVKVHFLLLSATYMYTGETWTHEPKVAHWRADLPQRQQSDARTVSHRWLSLSENEDTLFAISAWSVRMARMWCVRPIYEDVQS